jgi:hypothetical protein
MTDGPRAINFSSLEDLQRYNAGLYAKLTPEQQKECDEFIEAFVFETERKHWWRRLWRAVFKRL